jgi:hypothetical protein
MYSINVFLIAYNNEEVPNLIEFLVKITIFRKFTSTKTKLVIKSQNNFRRTSKTKFNYFFYYNKILENKNELII